MLIAQITDIHIGFDRGNPEEANLLRLRAVLDRLTHGPNRPDLLLMTGDLTEHGDDESFAILAREVAALPFPVYCMVGNHDRRDALLRAFPNTPSHDGFIHYAIERDGLRLLLLDTLDPTRHGGAFCAARAAWLRAELAAHPDVPTVIVMHHPTIVAGIAWMDPVADEDWIETFGAAIAGHSQIKAILTGHVHRTILGMWRGIPVAVCQSVAPRVALNLTSIDPDLPDGRDLITDELPAMGIHHWDGANLVSHYESVGQLTALARYDANLQPMIRSLLAEKPPEKSGAIFS